MKKITVYIGKPMTRKQARDLKNNPIVKLLNPKSEMDMMILLALSVPTIKGKIGFKVTSQDGVFLFNSTAIYNALLLNAGGYYTPAFGGMAALLAAIGAFQDAIDDVRRHVIGAEGAKLAAKKNVMRLLKKALNYVNDIAFDDQDNANEIIAGASMLVNKKINPAKQDFKVKQGDGTGLIALSCKAVSVDRKYYRASYEWQFSIDNGKTWENLPVTTKAKTVASGMLVGIATLFRKRFDSSVTGLSAWCDPMEIYPL